MPMFSLETHNHNLRVYWRLLEYHVYEDKERLKDNMRKLTHKVGRKAKRGRENYKGKKKE